MDEKNMSQYVYVSLDAYSALIERAVKAECERDTERSRRWELEAKLLATHTEIENKGGKENA